MTASRSWMITLAAQDSENSREGYSIEEVKELMGKYTFIAALERGKKQSSKKEEEAGYLHHQIYVENKTPIKFQTLANRFKKPKVSRYFSPRRATKQQAYDYVTKQDETFVGPIYGQGEIETTDSKGRRTDWDNFSETIQAGATNYELLTQFPEKFIKHPKAIQSIRVTARYQEYDSAKPLLVIYVGGETRLGKTSSVTHNFKDVFIVENYRNPWDEYKGQEIVVLDEFKSSLSLTEVKKVLEKNQSQDLWGRVEPKMVRARNQDVPLLANVIVVISNNRLEDQYYNTELDSHESVKAFRKRFAWSTWVSKSNRNEKIEEIINRIETHVPHLKVNNTQKENY